MRTLDLPLRKMHIRIFMYFVYKIGGGITSWATKGLRIPTLNITLQKKIK